MNLPTPAGSNIWLSVWKLLRLRWVIYTSGFRRAKLRGKAGFIALGLLVLAGLGFAGWLSWGLLSFMRSPELSKYVTDIDRVVRSVPILVISAGFAGILITSFGVLLQALYLAGDMDFLLSAPVPIRALFLAKLIQAILPNLGLVMFFGLPVLYGLGASGDYYILYYPLVLIVLILLAFAAAGLASLLVMGVVRIFPARRVAEVIGFVAAIASFTCSQSGQFMRYGEVSKEQTTQAITLLGRLDSGWSPLAWVGRSLVDIGEGRWLSGAGLLLLTTGLSAAIFYFSLAAAERLYYSGWARVQVSLRGKNPPRSSRALPENPLVQRLTGLIPAALRAIVVKDAKVHRRDLRNLSQLMTPLILGVVYSLMLIRSGGEPPAGRGEAPAWFMEILRNLVIYGNVAISLFVSWSLLARLAMMGFSHEGKSYWMLKTAPVSTLKLLGAKFLVAYLPTLVLGWSFLLAISIIQRASLDTIAYGLTVVALTTAGLGGLNLAFGVLGANFNWEDPRKISVGSTGCLGSLVSMALLALILVLFYGPLVLVDILGAPTMLGWLAGLLLGSGGCLACGIIPLWLVRERVARLNEI